MVVLAFVRPVLAVEEGARDLGSLGEAARALTRRPEVDAVGLVLSLIPRGADAKDRATVRDLVERRGHVREQRGVPVGDSRDERTEVRRLRRRGHRGEDRERLEVRALLLT